jgi:hypothetical protein
MTLVNLEEFIIINPSGLNKCQNLRIMDHVQERESGWWEREFHAINAPPPLNKRNKNLLPPTAPDFLLHKKTKRDSRGWHVKLELCHI